MYQLFQNIQIAFSSIRQNALRSILTLLIIAIGIMALVGILTAIDSIIYSLNEQFAGLGANSFTVSPDYQNIQSRRGGRTRRASDVISLEEAMEFKERFSTGVMGISFTPRTNIRVTHAGEKTNPTVTLTAMNKEEFNLRNYDLEKGRLFSETDEKYGHQVAIIGPDIVEGIVTESEVLDKLITIEGRKYRVIGVLESQGASMNRNADNIVLIPLMTGRKFYGHSRTNYKIQAGVGQEKDLQTAINEAIGLFRVIRNIPPGEPNDFRIQTSEGVIDLIKENTTTLRLATIAIGIITLIGAAIGLMNIMLVSVTERTREIGIRKSIGATRKVIMFQFLTEAVIICLLGGLAGIILGTLAGNLISIFTGSTFLIPWGWIFLGILLCVLTGIVSGYYPAYQAARLDPIESLRYE